MAALVLQARLAKAETATDGGAVAAAPAPAPAGEPAAAAGAPCAPHPRPRLKLGYRTFSIGNLDLTALPLGGLELDLYPISTGWLRGGITAAAGKGQGRMAGQDVSLRYGLLGVAAGVQYPARVTPFAEGTLSGGVLAGSTDGALAIPGTSTTLSGGSGATWIYGRGVDVGVELYTIGRIYLSGSVGWLRTTWRGLDVTAVAQAPAAGLRYKDLTADSLTFKLGAGF
jgi:hypothetical protein